MAYGPHSPLAQPPRRPASAPRRSRAGRSRGAPERQEAEHRPRAMHREAPCSAQNAFRLSQGLPVSVRRPWLRRAIGTGQLQGMVSWIELYLPVDEDGPAEVDGARGYPLR